MSFIVRAKDPNLNGTKFELIKYEQLGTGCCHWREKLSHTMGSHIPEVRLSSGHLMPAVVMGTATYPWPAPETLRQAVLDAIDVGYRHFDTAFIYDNERTEQSLGEAVAEALRRGLVKKREELFITSKLWGSHAHYDRVLPALQRSLRNLQLDYLDLFLIHWPFSFKSEESMFPIDTEDIIPIDLKSVWQAMEECQRLGLVRSIGVSNFTRKKLDQLLSSATIPPSVNQVEMNPLWQQKKMINFCEEKGIHVSAYSPLGGGGTTWGTNQVLQCNVLKEIAAAKGKSVAQICLRWVYQQGASVVMKSFNKERMKENIDIFDWALSEEELNMISQIQQSRGNTAEFFISPTGLFKAVEELWDGEM